MSSILESIRQRIANRRRPVSNADRFNPAANDQNNPQPANEQELVHHGEILPSASAVEEQRLNERNQSADTDITTSSTRPIDIGANFLVRPQTTEAELELQPQDQDVADTEATEAVTPTTPVCGSFCSSEFPSSLESSLRLDDHSLSPGPGVPSLRTRVMQRELFRNSPLSPTSPGLGRDAAGARNEDASGAECENCENEKDENQEAMSTCSEEPVTFSLREAVAKSDLAAFCGKLIEIPKQKLAARRNSLARRDSSASACVQQGVRCEHGDTCPFAFDVDGVSEDFLVRRRRHLQQRVGKLRAEDQLQVYATELGKAISDFEVVCDACLQVKHCVEVPNHNKQEKLLICSECMLPLLSGSWYHGMDTTDTVNVCSDLLRKASPRVAPRGRSGGSQDEDKETHVTLAELAGSAPSPDMLDTEEEFEAACREVTAKRKQAMSERCTARSPSLPVSDLDQPDGTVSLAEENKDDVPPMDTQFEDRRRPSGATAKLNLPLPSGSPSSQALSSSPAVCDSFSEGEFSDNLSLSTYAHSEFSSDLAPGLLPNQIAGQEPVGEVEIGLQMGFEPNKQRASFVVDILRGYNFKLWDSIGDKPGFDIYIKCYIIFPGRVVKMKTRCVQPRAQPEFLDQLISLMNKKLLQKAEQLKVQLWEDHGALKKKLAVGVATIDLTKLKMEELVMGCYPLYVPHRGSPKPASSASTPTSPSIANVSPGGTPPSLSRTGSGRFGSLRNSFKRKSRSSTGAAAASSPLVSESALSSSAPSSSALASTPTRTRSRYDSDHGGETDL